MNISRSALVAAIAAMCLPGCGQQTPLPPDSPAEVPAPGPAAPRDPGPAPDGQWEPPLDETPTSASDAEAAEDAAPRAATDPVRDSVETSEVVAPPHDAAPVTLELQTWDQTQALIAAHKGKVVVVDFWATSCLPCRREFPHLVELQKNHADEVACVSVSLDYSGRRSRPPEYYRQPVLQFLTSQGATFDNVLSTDDPDQLQQRLDLPPIPLVWVFDRAGERRKAFDNGDLDGREFTYADDVVPLVERLLAE